MTEHEDMERALGRMGGAYLDSKFGMVPDAVNPWKSIQIVIKEKEAGSADADHVMEEILAFDRMSYDEYINFHHPESTAEFIAGTDPKVKEKYDNLIHTLNSERKEILATKNYQRLREIISEAEKFLPLNPQ
ncbi:MAG TPA: hypothetical protein VEB42_14870 [Chitinophagaceae bacterium]|nr:hypothetical protein [Chitinophagaceae bacterium]